jgi:hypothetical protein
MPCRLVTRHKIKLATRFRLAKKALLAAPSSFLSVFGSRDYQRIKRSVCAWHRGIVGLL